MKLPIIITEYDDDFEEYFAQTVTSPICEDINYFVKNLTHCPEDAIIYRDLVSADDYIDILKLGMSLGLQGYDDIDIEVKEDTYDNL